MNEAVMSTEGTAFHAASAFSPRRRTMALVAVALAFVMDLLDTTIVNVAIPSIGSTIGAGSAALEWIVAGYAIAFAVLLIVGGRLGDSHGYRRMFLIGIALFTVTSLACGFAPTAIALQIARLLQGASAALMVPQVMALVQVMYPPDQRYKVYTVFGFLGGFSAALGPIVGGLLIDANWFDLGWRLTFLINLPIGVFSLIAGAMLLPRGRGVNAVPIDLGGALLSILVSFAILVPLIEGPARGWPPALVLLLATAVPVAWGTGHYLRWRDAVHRDALLSPALLKRRKVALGLLCTLCINPVVPGYLLVMTFVMQTGFGLSASQMAYASAPIALGAMVGLTLLGPLLYRRLGVRVLMVGVVVTASSLCVTAVSVHDGHLLHWVLLLGQFGMGLGMGLSGPQLSNATLHDVPMSDAGVAAGLLSALQQIAGAVGVALAGLAFFHSADGGNDTARHYAAAYLQTLPLFLGLLGAGFFISERLAGTTSK
ncbi:drug resistance transporter, EmrB/QacA subfamily [Rhizobium tibeticum]|uniref:Drug resistance transporter, EmrB/QacA subfamily n=1 Tax=Rhizobium tibeticum TaxID=501024 RepID=A0A1H8VR61_9HYPH|nr:MFS transporter [Rhizobium tibeticum]SEI19478.1 Spectinomycin tetracycline efflux pump [Rhizobium tibeticum]SEP17814.1 drug resistance transporter, EmrB/QacA subfamily [Rhizobium tibeticum]